ncbi:hypothetical protein F0919_16065 [Taibaiella lutea]|uniref:Pentapeptide MXKDX repeat protein n=1 Tax=Taibaiella lutea TaxID=2608001 RepID=A0A5M6CGR5_9BACT|nr:hypothetical protein [Taibaiella lutea]KAA5532309.1 hypothetical protein F0919_16065 [Taibaiella lutea]
MKKLMLAALTVICISGISFSQQDSTMTKNKAQKEQKDNNTKDNKSNSSGKKMKKQKTDSVNSNMDTTTRIETR